MRKETKEEVDLILIKKGFLNKKDVSDLSKKEKCSFDVLANELMELKVPFCHRKLKLFLEKNNVEIKNKNEINLDNIINLGDWVCNVFKKSKLKLTFKCKICNKEAKSLMSAFFRRKYFKNEPICSKCILKEATNTEQWKKNNSKAQFVAQNKPEQIELNRKIQIKLNKDKNFLKKISDALKEVWKRDEYRKT